MEKILTQEEIDALFRAAQGRASEGKQPAEERALAVCNFHQSARISKEQLRSVSQLHELFARNLTHSLGPTTAHFRSQSGVRRATQLR